MLVVVGNSVLLPRMLDGLRHPDLRWIFELDLLFHGLPERSGPPYRIRFHRFPILVYGKQDFLLAGGDDLIEVPAQEELPPGVDPYELGMARLVERFAEPGQVVCDPVMGKNAGTVLGSRDRGCTFIGAGERQSDIDQIWKRLAPMEDAEDGHPTGTAG